MKPSYSLLASLLLLSACGSSPPPDLYVAKEGRIHDALGRELFLHGINARVQGIFDVTFDDGRIAVEPIPTFTEDDCRFLAEELGLDHLRLPISWSAIEPVKGDYSDAYLGQVLEVVDACQRHGIHTLVDLHQDAYSKEIGEDGAPLWAIVPAPSMLLQGPLTDLASRVVSGDVQAAFTSLYDDTDGVRTAYAAMASWVAAHLAGRPGVVGFELQNEPLIIFGDPSPIEEFNNVIGTAVRNAAPTTTIFFEPNSMRNRTNSAPVGTPVPYGDAVYAPHFYVDTSMNGAAAIEASVTAAQSEANAHKAVLYAGEFGGGNDANGLLYANEAMAIFDEHLMGFAFWLYEEYSQGGWGLYDMVAGSDPPVRGALRTATADVLSRSYPVAIAGHVESFAFDPATKNLTVNVSSARGDVDHVLAVPNRAYPSGVKITCDGASVTATVANGRATFRCAGSTIALAPSP